jgi:hypothetical protein
VRTRVAVKVATEVAAGVSFEVLKMSGHPIDASFVRPNLPVADRAPLYAGGLQGQGFCQRDGLPARADP